MTMIPPPPIPDECEFTTPMQSAEAIDASTALPPCFSKPTPICVHTSASVATTACGYPRAAVCSERVPTIRGESKARMRRAHAVTQTTIAAVHRATNDPSPIAGVTPPRVQPITRPNNRHRKSRQKFKGILVLVVHGFVELSHNERGYHIEVTWRGKQLATIALA
eukprot:m.7601 g.7601  ORF g.7601 m.7601 type:complete len:165 (-) comp3975_c0_seq1:77-571(-)